MNLMRHTFALAVSGLLLNLGGVAHAVVGFPPPAANTYMFEAAAGSPDYFNGSEITIDGSLNVDSFSLVDTELAGSPFTSGSVYDVLISSATTSDWTGSFSVGVTGSQTFDLSGNPDSMRETTDIFASGRFDRGQVVNATPASDPFAAGTWTFVPAAAPDASSTFSMLLGILAFLAGACYCKRPQPVAALVRR